MTDLFEAMATRRSTRRFLARPVEMDKVLQVVQAGHLAPSAGNLQNWSFIVVSDVERIRELYHHTLDQEAFLTAPMAIVVCGDVEHAHRLYGMRGKRLYTIQNCAAAMENMLLAAHALGLGAVWIGAFDEDKVSVTFGIPQHAHRPQAIILLGYADGPADPKDVRELQEVIFFNQFGNKVLRPHLILYDWATEWRNQAQKVRQHLAHAREQVAERKPVEQVKQRSKDAFVETKEHLRQAINRLKKEEYRK